MICQVLGLDSDCLTLNNNDCLALSVPVGSLSDFSHSSSGFDSALSMLTYFLWTNLVFFVCLLFKQNIAFKIVIYN